MSFEDDDHATMEEAPTPTARIEALADGVLDDLDERSEDFAVLDEAWPVSVTAVDEAVATETWWDETPPDGVEYVQSDVELFYETVRDDCMAIVETMNRIDSGDFEDPNQELLATVVSIASIDAEADAFDRNLTVAKRTFGFSDGADAVYDDVKRWIHQKLKPVLETISRQLWKLLRDVSNLGSWSLGGDLGVSLLGLKGTASVSLTFER